MLISIIMNEQDFKDILSRPEINVAGIAEKLFEGKKNARARLYQKVTNAKSGHSTQRLTEEDLKKATQILRALAEDIKIACK